MNYFDNRDFLLSFINGEDEYAPFNTSLLVILCAINGLPSHLLKTQTSKLHKMTDQENGLSLNCVGLVTASYVSEMYFHRVFQINKNISFPDHIFFRILKYSKFLDEKMTLFKVLQLLFWRSLIWIPSVAMAWQCFGLLKLKNREVVGRNILAIYCRCISYQMQKTFKVCTWLIYKNKNFGSWKRVFKSVYIDNFNPLHDLVLEDPWRSR